MFNCGEVTPVRTKLPWRGPVVSGTKEPPALIPTTPVYQQNQAALDAFLGQPTCNLAGISSVGIASIANRFGPLSRKLDAIFDASSIRPKDKRILVTERWFNRRYDTPAYVFGRSCPPKGKTALLINAGTHGDESGAVLGMVAVFERVAADPELLQRFEPIVVIPCLHPASLDAGVRELPDGRDPNRLFFTNDPTRPASIRALEVEAERLVDDGRDALFIDVHQDDRYAADAAYALHGNSRSQDVALAAIAGLRDCGASIVESEVDGLANKQGSLPKDYPGSFAVPPQAKLRANPPVELILEINRAEHVLAAIEAAILAV